MHLFSKYWMLLNLRNGNLSYAIFRTFETEFYFRIFLLCARLVSDESLHVVCGHESKAYKHTKII